jgi:uncharacterized NAD(P)/FAD-binding protein YdhS
VTKVYSKKTWSVAIVGTGATAVALFSYMVSQFGKQQEGLFIKITLFERKQEYLACGIAYQEDADSLILNRNATEMTLFPDDKTHFRRWLLNSEKHRHHLDLSEFVPRHVYGDYLKEIFEETIETAVSNGIEVNVIKAEIVKLDKGQNYILEDENGKKYSFDFVNLCLGHPQSIDNYNLRNASNYIHHPHPAKDTLKIIPKNAKVGIIGAGLTVSAP